jgi:FkbM family methyltransferase
VVRRRNDFIARRRDPVILDCGANIGISAALQAALSAARIVAFEPDKGICEELRKNLIANGAEDVEVVEAAIWTAAGQHAFLSEGADGSRLIEQSAGPQGGNEYAVRTVRFADYLGELVDFVKLDIEGAESTVLVDCADRLGNVESMVNGISLDEQQSAVADANI